MTRRATRSPRGAPGAFRYSGTSLLRWSKQEQQQCEQTRGETAAGGSTEATKGTTRWRRRGSGWWRVIWSWEENRYGQEVPGLLPHEQVHQLRPPGSRRAAQVHLLDTQSVSKTWPWPWRWAKVFLCYSCGKSFTCGRNIICEICVRLNVRYM